MYIGHRIIHALLIFPKVRVLHTLFGKDGRFERQMSNNSNKMFEVDVSVFHKIIK